MPEIAKTLRIGEAAALLGVSVDTVRRWADSGRLATVRSDKGQRLVDGPGLAAYMTHSADAAGRDTSTQSARNRLRGVVTRVVKDGVTAQVEMQAGPYRVVSLMTREAADELQLEPGVVAVAVIKATNVVVERSPGPQ
jgi:molybdopterin-binding protein